MTGRKVYIYIMFAFHLYLNTSILNIFVCVVKKYFMQQEISK